MNILGLSAGFHDAGMAFVSDGEIPFAGHAERYSKQKHDSRLNSQILENYLQHYNIPNIITYYEKP